MSLRKCYEKKHLIRINYTEKVINIIRGRKASKYFKGKWEKSTTLCKPKLKRARGEKY